MEKMPLFVFIFQAIPESIIIFSLGAIAVNGTFQWRRLLLASLIYALCGYLVRMLPLPFGYHMLVALIIITLCMVFVMRFTFVRAVTASLIGVEALSLVESLFVFLIMKLLGYQSIKDIWQNSFLRIVISIPHLTVLAIIAYYLKKKQIYIFKQVSREFDANGEK